MTKKSVAVVAALLCAAMVYPRTARTRAATHPTRFRPLATALSAVPLVMDASALTPPSDALCLAVTEQFLGFGVHCYSPEQIRRAYDFTPLLNAGFTGRGETIVIVVSFGSPTIEHDLKVFDAAFNLPDPPSFQVIAPLGTVPFDRTKPHRLDWALETTLDVEWAHALAPEANIVVLTSPTDETEGVDGMPEFLQLEQYALDHHLGRIISQSWGTTEDTLFDEPGQRLVANFERFYRRAKDEHVTVLAGTGDSGATNPDINFKLLPFRASLYPASSPFVTAVGGTSLQADFDGNYLSETVWNGFGATGGGVSKQFREPSYQHLLPPAVQSLLGGHRGVPDVSFNGDPVTGVILVQSFFAGIDQFLIGFGGTSASTPQWAGLVAIANQRAGRPLGFLNPVVYRLAANGRLAGGLHDVTVGNNSFAGVAGFNAAQGWDAVTGWGSPSATDLVLALIDDRGEDDGDSR